MRRDGDTIVVSGRRPDRHDFLECILSAMSLLCALVLPSALLSPRPAADELVALCAPIAVLSVYVLWATRPRTLRLRTDGSLELVTPRLIGSGVARTFSSSESALVAGHIQVVNRAPLVFGLSHRTHFLGVRLGESHYVPLVATQTADKLVQICEQFGVRPIEQVALSTGDSHPKTPFAVLSGVCFRVSQDGSTFTTCDPEVRSTLLRRLHSAPPA